MADLKNINYKAPKKRVAVFINETIFRESKAQGVREGYTFSEIVELVLEYYLANLAYTNKELAGIKKTRETKNK